MDARTESKQCLLFHLLKVLIGCRTSQQVTDRLDALIQKIYALQKDSMHGEKSADVVLVSENTPSVRHPELDISI